MDNETTIRYVSVIVRRCIGKDQTGDWILLLSDYDLLTRAQRKSTLTQEYDEAIRQSCSYMLSAKDNIEKLTKAFADDEFEGDPKLAEIIKKVIEMREISDALAWMIDSWDILRGSDELREMAVSECPEISKEDWPLDFIYHIVTTENSYIEEFFVDKAKKFLKNQQQQQTENSSNMTEEMEVDAKTKPDEEETQSNGSQMSTEEYQEDLPPSIFPTLDSDGEVKDEDGRQEEQKPRKVSSEKTPESSILFVSSQHFDESRPPGVHVLHATTEDILQEVKAFDTESPFPGKSLDWEVVDLPGTEEQTGDNEPTTQACEQHFVPHSPLLKNNVEQETAESEKQAQEKQTVSSTPPKSPTVRTTPTRVIPLPWPYMPLESHTSSETVKQTSKLSTEESSLEHENADTRHNAKDKEEDTQVNSPEASMRVKSFQSELKIHVGGPQESKLPNKAPQKRDQAITTPRQSSVEKESGTAETRINIDIPTSHDHTEASVQRQEEASTIPAEHAGGDRKALEEAVTKPTGPNEKTSEKPATDASDDSEECGSLDWFSGSIAELKKYKFNIQLLTKLAWPKEESLLDEPIWPYNLISWLEKFSKADEGFVDHFISVCKRVIGTEPLVEKYTDEEGKSGVAWLRSNTNLFVASKEDVVSLYQLGWPGENLESHMEGMEVLDAVFSKNKKQKHRPKVKLFSCASKMFIEGSHKRATTKIKALVDKQQPEEVKTDKPSHKKTAPPEQSPAQVSGPLKDQNLSKPSDKTSGADEGKDGEKEEKIASTSELSEQAKTRSGKGYADKTSVAKEGKDGQQQETIASASQGSKQAKTSSGKSYADKAKERVAVKDQTTSSPHPRPQDRPEKQPDKATADKSKSASDKYEEFHDAVASFEEAVANLEDCVILTKPPSDRRLEMDDFSKDIIPQYLLSILDSFELRAVYMETDPNITTMYVIENKWHNWVAVKMKYNRERHFYYVCLPLPEGDFRFEYKYIVQVEGCKYAHEYLQSSYGQIVNRRISLSKDTKYTHDVPVFPSQLRYREMLNDVIAKVVHFHLPPAQKPSLVAESVESYVSYKNEIYSWVKRMKNGWHTTHYHFHTINLSAEQFDRASMKWIAQFPVDGNETDVMNRILAILNFLVALCQLKHRIQETKLVQSLCNGLSVEALDAKHQKRLYQLIKQEFSTKGSSSCSVAREALIWLYRQLSTLLGSASPWMQWILTLPLYWLIMNNGEVKKKVAISKKGGSLLFGKSALPEAENLPWSDVRTKSKSDSCQRSLVSLSDKILQISDIHPWIIGSYQYVLTENFLIQILKNPEKYSIGWKLSLDSVLSSILREWKSSTGKQQALNDAISVQRYFDDAFHLIQDRKDQRTEDERGEQREMARNILNLIMKVTGDFIGHEMYSAEKYRNLLFLVKMTNNVAEWFIQLLDKEKEHEEIRGDLSLITTAVCEKISKLYRMDEDEIKFIDALLRTTWSDEKIQKRWVALIKNEIRSLIKKAWKRKEAFLEFYVNSAEKYKMEKNLEECIEEHAFNCTENLLRDLKATWGPVFFTPRFIKLFGKLFNKEYDEIFSGSNAGQPIRGIMKCLRFVVQWSFAPHFYKAFYKEKSVNHLLPEDVREKAGRIEREFRDAVTSFCSGRMKISETEYFIQNETAILKFYSTLISVTSGTEASIDDMLATHLSLRRSQLEAINASRRNLRTFTSLCAELEDVHINVEVDELEQLPLMKDEMVYKVVEPNHKPAKPERGLQTFDKLTDVITNDLQIINSVHNSKTFEKVWKNVLDEEEEKKAEGEEINITWKEVIGQIWPIAKDRTFSVFSDISDGSIDVSVLAELFSFSEGDKSIISNEIFSLAAGSIQNDQKGSDKLLQQRCDQIEKLLRLKKCEKASRLMLKLKKVLDLDGDFQCVEVIQSMEESEEVALKDVNLDIDENFADDLWSDSEFLDLLEKFAEQEDLIFWLKSEMKDLSEVKVFCDLGMISAGETSYEVDRVSFLLSAVMGFAPLIFSLNLEAGLKEVMEKCRIVKNNVDSDDKLIHKWIDTGRQLTWFEGIHKLHGSVGTQSLTLAQEINSRGIYIISKPKQGTPTIENSLKLSLQPIVKVVEEVAEAAERTAAEVKFVTYDGLKDLQSKLMLIAGEAEQGHQDVARFNDVLSAAANLTQGFINLINAGCMLFNNWSARIICSKDELVISLNFNDDIPPISTTSCLRDLELLVDVMNIALVQWTEYIDKMRQKHYYLNDYNIQQITYLCQKLAKSDFTDQVFSLLSDLRRIQICNHMQNALDEATEIQEDEEIVPDENIDNENETLTIVEVKSRMVRELAKNGLDENLAKAAVQCEENKDLEDCENWALLHQHEDDVIQELSEDFDEEAGFGPETNKVQNYTSLLHNRMSLTLKELITQIQEKEQESNTEMRIHSIVKTICVTYNDKTSKLTLQDSLSIDHLGSFLNILRQKLGTYSGKVERELIAPMLPGKANLVLIPTGDMLYTTLSMYMRSEDQPLPKKSEVLICTESTSEDEVGLFLRRAMCRNPRKEKHLFCMLFADKLTFNVSTHVECLWNSLSMRENLDPYYQLVILCSTTSQQHYLVTCFDRTRVELKLATDKEKISKYLCSKLRKENAEEASVKLVSSKRSGVGKSLHVKRLIEQLDETTHVTTIRLLQKEIDIDHVIGKLYHRKKILNEDAHLIHIDLTSAVENGIEEFAFNLFVLGSIQDSQGQIWRHHSQHFYAVEMTESKLLLGNSVLNLIPHTKCLSPKIVIEKYNAGQEGLRENEILMDRQEFESQTFQRPFQYLKQYDAGSDLDKFHYVQPAGTEQECIAVLLNHCGMKNPSWAQLKYFSSFLNVQLINCEESIFCKKIQGGGRQDLIEFRGLKAFAVHFMLKMAQDFATPSLRISDESTRDDKDALEHYAIRRRWEDEIHPFVFFNEDRITMTFINVNVNDNGDLLKMDGSVAKRGMVSRQLVADLKHQGVPFGVKFNTLSREDKIRILCQFMNIPREFDPDKTYELTTDNVLKMLAIYMRLRCQIPVIVMGETGCGKTRMIEFMSKMRSGQSKDARNMVTLKIHGGIQVRDIYQSVKEAKAIAVQNKQEHNLSTILFYDEANTTSAIYAIKEVVCDFSIDGEDFRNSQLQIVAACNPYKQLSDEAVKKLEASGLGYNIRASEAEQVGHVPMRRLVYRVVALPPSMQPFVWDFGQLGNEAEEIYIKQMTNHLKEELELRDADGTLLHAVLFNAQCYMRQKCKDESRYVSLRDVERSLKTFRWFYQHFDHIFPDVIDYHNDKGYDTLLDLPRVLRCLLHTISVCYHASLDDRKSFRCAVSRILSQHSIQLSEMEINREITACQMVFTASLKMDDNIACNEALRENVFLMTVCTDLRIPLFVVGKPGSSKSLAKTIVGDNMQGKTSYSDLYKHFKQVHILSYQCSALTDAAGIESIFNQCAQLQSNQDIDAYAAVVVLDEIGLAEDSPNMPLKVLHPLLECGSTKNGTLTEFDKKRKVAFVGISNWALDPAKMNRGIFVTRSSPNEKDLKKTAEGIFEKQRNRMRVHSKTIKALTEAYLSLYRKQKKEYFGLRDYYSLIKMLHANLKKRFTITQKDVENAIQRNFSGGEKNQGDIFRDALGYTTILGEVSVQDMVQQNLMDDKSRFLLLLANQYSAFSLLQNFIPDFHNKVQVIFGSSFPNDHSYTEMCRNINRVKVCMETGRTVILLNMNEINESLYDALNQHYVTLGGQRYVDLGLGGHRVKCRIADGFRMIVIELKEKVYNEYPIPLINRLEKHHLTSNSLLTRSEKAAAEELSGWVEKFSKIRGTGFTPSHAFLGHNEDSVSSVAISHKQDTEGSKEIILQSATMDAVFRLPKAELGSENTVLLQAYVKKQIHDNLCRLLKSRLEGDGRQDVVLMEITTFSNILSDSDRKDLEYLLDCGPRSVMLLSLQQFQTEQDYLKKLDEFFNFCNKESTNEKAPNAAVLLVQCPQAHKHTQLIACARYGLKNKLTQISKSKKKIVIALLLSTERKLTSGKSGNEEGALSLQHSSDCEIIYIDELRPTFRSFGQTSQFHGKTICGVLEIGRNSINPRQEGDELGINMPTLLNDCICEAMAKVKSKAKNDQRNLDCIQILCQLCTGQDEINYHFLTVLTTKMIKIYQEREDKIYETEPWIVKEACSAEKLQEGGTFAKTLWLCLKNHVSHLLAYIISLIDADDNLDIISDTSEKNVRVRNMWMEMFNACRVKWEDMKGHKEFFTQGKPYQPDGNELRIPFFFLINTTFEERWAALKGEHRDAEKRQMFFNLFCSSNPKMNDAITNVLQLRKPVDIVNAFAKKLIKINFSAKGQSATKLSETLVNITTLLFQKLRDKKENLPGSHWFLILFYCMKEHHPHLKVLNDIINLCPQSIKNMDSWIQEIKNKNLIIIHKKALEFALQCAKDMALQIKDAKFCCDWMNFTRRLRTIFNSAMVLLKDDNDKQELLINWEPLAMLDMLFLHLLPNPSQDDVFKKYVEVIASHAKLLYKGTSKSGLRGQQFLRIVCNVLRKYFDDVKLKVLLDWQNPQCRICRKPCKIPTVLPCGHYFCCACLTNALISSQDQKKCLSCSKVLPDDYKPVPTMPTQAQTAEVEAFQSHCTSFFMEYLSKFVFPAFNNVPGQEDVIHLILEELVLNSATNEETQKPELEKTALNMNVATMTNILSILFGFDHREVEDLLNRFLGQQQNIESIVLVILKHFEQQYVQLRHVDETTCLKSCTKLLRKFTKRLENRDTALSVEFLQIIAGARYSILQFVKTITQKEASDEDEIENAMRNTLLYNIRSVIQSDRSEVLKEYFIKVGCHMNGMDWFTNIMQSAYKNLVPERLKNTGEMNAVDYYTALGAGYSDVRSEISKTAITNHKDKLKDWFPKNQNCLDAENFMKILAVTSCLRDQRRHKGTFRDHFQAVLPQNVELLDFTCAIIDDAKKWTRGAAALSRQQKSVFEQIIPLIAGVVKLQPAMMGELRTLMTDPKQVAQLFWPAMPESFYFSMPQGLRASGGADAMYQCPNGHYYTIGNCTKPVTTSRCPDCHAVIGGISYVAQAGNQRVQKMEERSQAGYMLRSTDKNLQNPEDRISMQATSVVQLLIHTCMLIGLQRNPASIPQILPGMPPHNVGEYLLGEMNKNIQNLAKSIGRNVDETTLVICRTMLNILQTNVNQGSAASNSSWASIANRKDWEQQFRVTFLLPVFQHIDVAINEAQQNLNAAEDMTSIALFRIVHEVKEEEHARGDAAVVWWRNPCVWHIIKHPTASDLEQSIRNNPNRETGAVLQTVLESPELELLEYLEDVLDLQKSMIERLQNKIDLAEAEDTTIDGFIREDPETVDRVAKYVQAWNKLRHKLRTSGECDQQMTGWFDEELSADSPISSLLPSTRGRGRCAKLLTEYLVEIQNRFLLKCFEIAEMNASENEVEASQLSSSHLIRIDKQADLLPLINLHTSYTVEEDGYGRHHHISYNIDALEKQARENFIKNKKVIVGETLPSIKYTQDVGIGSDWDKVIVNSKLQEPLSAKLMQTVDELVATVTPAEVCEGVRTLTYAISFLAKVESKPTRMLHEYLEKDLLLAKSRTAVIPRFAKIYHTLALYQHLTWHKAVNFVQQGLQPYQEALYQVNQEKITDQKVLRAVRDAFEHMDVIVFQQHLNEMLIKVPDYNEDWSMVEHIFPNLQFIGDEEPEDTWFERIPPEICFKHISHLFELAVNHIQNAG